MLRTQLVAVEVSATRIEVVPFDRRKATTTPHEVKQRIAGVNCAIESFAQEGYADPFIVIIKRSRGGLSKVEGNTIAHALATTPH